MLYIEQSSKETMSIVGYVVQEELFVGENLSIMEEPFVGESLFIIGDVVHRKLHNGDICGSCSL